MFVFKAFRIPCFQAQLWFLQTIAGIAEGGM